MEKNNQDKNNHSEAAMTSNYRLVVIGLGYVGLTLAGVYAQAGFRTVGVDNNERIVVALKSGQPHFHENNLPELLHEVKDTLLFSTTIPKSESTSTIFVIAVGTSLDHDGQADYSQIDQSVRDIAAVVQSGDIVILRSTVVVGTTRNRVVPALEALSGLMVGRDIFVGFAPERTVEGKAIEELRTLPQVAAATSEEGVTLIKNFFTTVSETVITVESLEAAEMVKLISNAYRDLTFAFANGVALAAHEHNVDVNSLIQAANYGYERNRIPLPSPGVGGYCLTKDPYLFAHSSPTAKDIFEFTQASRRINDAMPQHVAGLVMDAIQRKGVTNPKVVLVGLAFKSSPATSDVRFSPSLGLVDALKAAGVTDLSAYDEFVHDAVFVEYGLQRCNSLIECIDAGSVIVFMHGGERYLDQSFISTMLEKPSETIIIDTWDTYGEHFRAVPNLWYATLSYKNY